MSRGDSGYMSQYNSIYSSKSDDNFDFEELQSSIDNYNYLHNKPTSNPIQSEYRIPRISSLYENQNGQASSEFMGKFDASQSSNLRKYPSPNTGIDTKVPQIINAPVSPRPSPLEHPSSPNPSLWSQSTHQQQNNYNSNVNSNTYSPRPFQPNNNYSPQNSPQYLPQYQPQNSPQYSSQYSPQYSPQRLPSNTPIPVSQNRIHLSMPAKANRSRPPIVRSNTYYDGQLAYSELKDHSKDQLKNFSNNVPKKNSQNVPISKDPPPRLTDNLRASTFDFTEIHSFIDHYCEEHDDKDDNKSMNNEVKTGSVLEETTKKRNREAAVSEILTTERSYVDGLKKLVNVFLLPLQENYKANQKAGLLSSKPVASSEDINSIFGNISPLLNLHEQLLKSLEERLAEWNSKEIISDVFLQIAPFLKMYTTYLQAFPHAINTLERLNKENKEFKKFLQHCQSRPELGGLPFNSFLSLPIQRIPRYKLLLEALLKHTDASHPDYANLRKCFQQIGEVADEVNEKIRDAENQQKVLEIQYKVEGLAGNIVNPARRFIFEGDLYKVNSRNSATKPFYMATQDIRTHFLFNNLLLFCMKYQGKLIFKGQIDLNRATLKDIEDDIADKPYCFQIVTITPSGEARHTVRTTTAEEKAGWMSRLESALSGLKNVIRGPDAGFVKTLPKGSPNRSNSNRLQIPNLLYPSFEPQKSSNFYKQTTRAADDLFIRPNRNNQNDQRMKGLRPQVSHGNLRSNITYNSPVTN